MRRPVEPAVPQDDLRRGGRGDLRVARLPKRQRRYLRPAGKLLGGASVDGERGPSLHGERPPNISPYRLGRSGRRRRRMGGHAQRHERHLRAARERLGRPSMDVERRRRLHGDRVAGSSRHRVRRSGRRHHRMVRLSARQLGYIRAARERIGCRSMDVRRGRSLLSVLGSVLSDYCERRLGRSRRRMGGLSQRHERYLRAARERIGRRSMDVERRRRLHGDRNTEPSRDRFGRRGRRHRSMDR